MSGKAEREAAARAFECRSLRLAAYGAWGILLLWAIVAGVLDASKNTVWAEFFLRWTIVPLWLVFAFHGAYYLWLLAVRFRVGLGAFLLLIAVWGNWTALAWATGGWQAGLSVALGAGALLGFGVTWSESVARLLGHSGAWPRVGLAALGCAVPPALACLPLSGCLAWWFYTHAEWTLAAYGLAACLASLCVLAWSGVWSLRARRAAQACWSADTTANPPVPAARGGL